MVQWVEQGTNTARVRDSFPSGASCNENDVVTVLKGINIHIKCLKLPVLYLVQYSAK